MWWNVAYKYRVSIAISGGPFGRGADEQINVVCDTRDLINAGQCLPTRQDFRLVYQGQEIDRYMITTGDIAFRLQAPISADSQSVDEYFLYFGNPGEITEPMQNPANCLRFYADGYTGGYAAVAGTVTEYDMPKPGYLKHFANPVITRQPNTGTCANKRDCAGLFWDDATQLWYAYYDGNEYIEEEGVCSIDPNETDHDTCTDILGGEWIYTYHQLYDSMNKGWSIYLDTSPDLKNWTQVGEKLWDETHRTASSSGMMQKIGDTYYMDYIEAGATYLWNVPFFPYPAHLATATDPAGPWTKRGLIIPLGTPASAFDSSATAAGCMIQVGELWYHYYTTTSSASYGQGVALAISETPGGPRTKVKEIIPRTANTENPWVAYDPDRQIYYLSTNVSGGHDGNDFYWSVDPLNWDEQNKTQIISSEPGNWDEGVIGYMPPLFVKDGMTYSAYDGANKSDAGRESGHNFRDIGVVEARWPFAWGKGIRVVGGNVSWGTVTDNSVIRFKARFNTAGQGQIGFTVGTSVYAFRKTSAGVLQYITPTGPVVIDRQDPIFNRTKNFYFFKNGTSLSMYLDGDLVFQTTTVPVGGMTPIASGDVIVEEIQGMPYTPLTATLGSVESGDPGVIQAVGYDLILSTGTASAAGSGFSAASGLESSVQIGTATATQHGSSTAAGIEVTIQGGTASVIGIGTVQSAGSETSAQTGVAGAAASGVSQASGTELLAAIGQASATCAAASAAAGVELAMGQGNATGMGQGSALASMSVELNMEYGNATASSPPSIQAGKYLQINGKLYALKDQQGRIFALR